MTLFFNRFEQWLHPNATATAEASEGGDSHAHAAPHPSYDNASSLYVAMAAAHGELQEDVGKWRSVQDLIHSKARELEAAGLPAYTDADEPEDDGYQVPAPQAAAMARSNEGAACWALQEALCLRPLKRGNGTLTRGSFALANRRAFKVGTCRATWTTLCGQRGCVRGWANWVN